MRIAVTTNEKKMDAPVEERFGRCQFFALLDTSSGDVTFVPNAGAEASSGAGVKAAQQLIDLEVELLVTGQVGPGALDILKEGEVRVESWTAGTVAETLKRCAP
jgi:predicted Fe-Mo cluster-binding NifX family protein